jgi:hypothetical protein
MQSVRHKSGPQTITHRVRTVSIPAPTNGPSRLNYDSVEDPFQFERLLTKQQIAFEIVRHIIQLNEFEPHELSARIIVVRYL